MWTLNFCSRAGVLPTGSKLLRIYEVKEVFNISESQKCHSWPKLLSIKTSQQTFSPPRHASLQPCHGRARPSYQLSPSGRQRACSAPSLCPREQQHRLRGVCAYWVGSKPKGHPFLRPLMPAKLPPVWRVNEASCRQAEMVACKKSAKNGQCYVFYRHKRLSLLKKLVSRPREPFRQGNWILTTQKLSLSFVNSRSNHTQKQRKNRSGIFLIMRTNAETVVSQPSHKMTNGLHNRESSVS